MKRTFTREFKLSLCEKVKLGQQSQSAACREHSLTPSLWDRWMEKYESKGQAAFSDAVPMDSERRIRELEASLGRAHDLFPLKCPTSVVRSVWNHIEMAKGKKHTEDEILKVLKEIEAGASIASVARAHGITDQTIYRWRDKYGGMQSTELKELRQLQAENQRL